MRAHSRQTGRHRLGMADGVHCIEFPQVAFALSEHRRTWLTSLISQGRHSFTAIRKRTTDMSAHWIPVTAN
ncbi:hypothetical protein [Rhodococcus sp. NPDC058521]|uniref:hypothetical protein n=1 Tax=Rhodococcus sp. NPDC058521 TaxID=3346536 RepID=UPI003660CBE5